MPGTVLLQTRPWTGRAATEPRELVRVLCFVDEETEAWSSAICPSRSALVEGQGPELGSPCSFNNRMLPQKIKQTTSDDLTGKYDLGRGGLEARLE